jgi:alkaline phosphatase D
VPNASPSPFTHAVASFDPTADGVLLWTRVDPSAWPTPARVTWRVSRDVDATDVVAHGNADIPPDGDG